MAYKGRRTIFYTAAYLKYLLIYILQHSHLYLSYESLALLACLQLLSLQGQSQLLFGSQLHA